MSRSEFCKTVGAPERKHLVGVFAGSRKAEIGSFFPNCLKAIETLCRMRSDVEFVISQGNAALTERIQALVAARKLPADVLSRMHFIDSGSNYDLMANSDLVWAKSGTTALEAMLFGTPMLIFYRGYWISFLLVLLFKRVQRVGWPNLLAGKYLVPELIQLDCRAELFVRYTDDLLDVPALRSEVRSQLLTLRTQLGQGDYATNCVEEILSALGITRQLPTPSQANV
jgi:lipid-A-disaccharide synthase